jgi:hypothetical protein
MLVFSELARLRRLTRVSGSHRPSTMLASRLS